MDNSVTGVDWWTLLLTIVGAATGIAALAWVWIDRPRTVWLLRRTLPPPKWVKVDERTTAMRSVAVDEPHEIEIWVEMVGSGVAHNVEFRTVGCRIRESSGGPLTAARMAAGGEALEATARLPGADHGEAWLEVIWLRPRPLLRQGQRFNLRTNAIERWRWHWRSVRLRGRAEGDPWWWRRPTRTDGEWVRAAEWPRAEIPPGRP